MPSKNDIIKATARMNELQRLVRRAPKSEQARIRKDIDQIKKWLYNNVIPKEK